MSIPQRPKKLDHGFGRGVHFSLLILTPPEILKMLAATPPSE